MYDLRVGLSGKTTSPAFAPKHTADNQPLVGMSKYNLSYYAYSGV